MSSPLHGVVEEGQSNISLVNSFQTSSELKERNYMGLPDCPSEDSSVISSSSDEKKSNLNLKATELRLGLPGPQSPERDQELCLLSSGNLNEKQLFPLLPSKDGIFSSSQKTALLGNKRGFSDAMSGFSSRSSNNSGVKSLSVEENTGPELGMLKKILPLEGLKDGRHTANESNHNLMDPSTGTSNPPAAKAQVVGWPPIKSSNNTINSSAAKAQVVGWPPIKSSNNNCNTPSSKAQPVGWPPVKSSRNTSNPPAAKAQVVGWPPVRSFRKNTLASTSKNNDEVDGKPGPGPLYVKVSMDGAPYLRKVDLRNYSTYQELSSALEKMFSCFSIGQCGSDGAPASEMLSESKLRDLLHGSEDVLTYEDKDGDWMLVGDVPWEMFIDSCKRLRIMKSTDAIGLAPRAVEKCKSRN